ncbi:nucleotidyltransferase domain-containing protein [Bacillus cereus]|uniref:nucleotidyltransferase domain-containing protein n=1 Tax=Bacillus pseudomycoides TaxID=64104 RepID=UPI001FB34D64|nr:nucleotidyltransferase domain-containing protein [Bacillus pseudomycoides]WJE54710.1 nucleotidyltransferase domain-containing protein [Bacillus cereus]
MVVEAVEKGGKALLDGAKKVSSKVKEGVSFVASKTKSFADKVGDLWNKGKIKVKTDFIEADKAFRYAIKKLGEYVPKSGRGLAFETESAGKIPSGGKNLLQDAYQYVKDTGERVFGSGEKDVVKGANGLKIPQGLTEEQFSNMSNLLKSEFGNISDDIFVQGSRAGGTAKLTSDIDIGVRVSEEQFEGLVKKNLELQIQVL